MKKSPTKYKNEKKSQIAKIPKDQVIRNFENLGFSEDYKMLDITVLRQKHFPFGRVTIPNNHYISTELLRLFLHDMGIDVTTFLQAKD